MAFVDGSGTLAPPPLPWLAALSRTARLQAEQLARRTEHVDLSADPDFQAIFAESMVFPEEER